MKPIPFDPDSDLAPIPFDQRTLSLAYDLKNAGLKWRPHVGCFAWDRERHIHPDSPFPNNVYFILSLPRFIDLFGTRASIAQKMVWIPTWHQARLLCKKIGITDASIAAMWQRGKELAVDDDVCGLYELLIENYNSFFPTLY